MLAAGLTLAGLAGLFAACTLAGLGYQWEPLALGLASVVAVGVAVRREP